MHHGVTSAQFGADLLLAGGDGEGLGIVAGLTEQGDQLIDPAEVGPLRVDTAAAGAGVEVAAPAVFSHHRKVELLLLGVEGFDRIAP